MKPVLAMYLLFLALAGKVFAQDPPQFEFLKINDNLYIGSHIWGENSKGNFGVLVGQEGILLINALMANAAPVLDDELRSDWQTGQNGHQQ